MPYTEQHKAQTRENIVRSARALFNQRGFSDVSIDEVMEGAGLTRGGFYAHFDTKEELYAEAVTHILVEHPAEHWEGVDLDLTGPPLAAAIVNAYLGDHHFGDLAGSCPMIAIPSDISRSGDTVKAAFRQVLGAMTGIFEANLGAPSDKPRQDALAVAAVCVGGMVLARGLDDRQLGDDIRAASLALALRVGGWEAPGAAAP